MSKRKVGRPEKWTTKEILKIGNELIDWMLEKPENIWFENFFYIEKGLYPQIVSEFTEKCPEFSLSINRAKKIQEGKIIDQSLRMHLSSAISIFVLKNNHGYKDKVEQAIEHSGGLDISIEIITPNAKKKD